MATSGNSLVAAFDDLVRGTDVLTAGTEQDFVKFVNHQMGLYKKVDSLKAENDRLIKDNDSKEINMKLSRKALKDQIRKRTETEESVKQYEKQFTIICELLSSNDRLSRLNDAEKRSLAFLKERGRRSSINEAGSVLSDSCEMVNSSDGSIAAVDATDMDQDVSLLRNGTRWKRRRTTSTDRVLDSSLAKKKKSQDGLAVPANNENMHLSIRTQLHMTPPLEKMFKKPARKGRRKPSKTHLKEMTSNDVTETSDSVETPPVTYTPPPIPQFNLSPLDFPECTDGSSPRPSAPPEEEVRLTPMLSPPPIPPRCYGGYHSPTPPIHMMEQQHLPGFSGNISPQMNMSPPINFSPRATMSPRLYPDLDEEMEGTAGLSTPHAATPSSRAAIHTDINMTRRHTFFTKTLMKTDSCEVCKKKIGFGRNGLKCKDCRAVCHVECKEKVPLPCVPSVHTPKKKLKDSDLMMFCPNSIPRVPSLVVHCVKEIEERGLTQVGLYRVPGSDKSVRELRDRLLKPKGTPNLGKIDDVNVLCGCVKDFLRKLREPLVTFKLHPTFLQVLENKDDQLLPALLETIAQLPPCNKDTLAFIILHLQKVAFHSMENKMPATSLAKVFGPTIVGYRSANPDPNTIWKDTQHQAKLMEQFLAISPEYWRQYVSPEDDPPSPSPAPTYSVMSPATPEMIPVPASPFLGPCGSPGVWRRANVNRTPANIVRSTSNASVTSISRSVKKKGGNFFAALN